ncbi:MAG: ComEC/Rec2 family competence protein [Candidatus Sumerlaeia bacterium]|nr:ComEC/Rec2 family competence protein [Candidatus Sumerlaeia bacterium]
MAHAAAAYLCGALAWPPPASHWEPVFALALGALAAALGPWRRAARLALLLAGFAALGSAQQGRLAEREALAFASLESVMDTAEVLAEAEGVVARPPARTATGSWRVELAAPVRLASAGRTVELPAPMLAYLPDETPPRAGDRARILGAVRELTHSRSERTPDRGFRAHGFVAILNGKALLASEPTGALLPRLWQLAEDAARATGDATLASLPGPEGRLLNALLLGDTAGLEPPLYEAFERSGLVHIFSVSGFHTMLVGMVTLWFLRWLGFGAWPRVAVFVPSLAWFVVMTGAEPPVLRSALLLAVFALSEAWERPVDGPSALSCVFLALAMQAPGAIHTLEFQLTFLCAAVLVLSTPWTIRIEEVAGRPIRYYPGSDFAIAALKALFVTTAIQLGAAPLLADWFGQVSLAAPLANALLLAPLSFLVLAGFVAHLLGAVLPELAVMPLSALELPLALCADLVRGLGALPWASAPAPALPGPALAAWLGLVLAGPWTWRWPTPERAPLGRLAATAGLLATVFLWAPLLRGPLPPLTVWFLDVGQGDAILLRTGDGRFALVDAGREGQAARWLEALRVRRLDWMALTHADADHIGGAVAVLDAAEVAAVLDAGGMAETAVFGELRARLLHADAIASSLARGDRFRFGHPPVEVEVLHPTERFLAEGSARNDASLVLRVSVAGRAAALLTGDAELEAEADILAAGADVAAPILKAGHHGARAATGDALLAAARPAVVVASAGAGNNFGHPSPEVLARASAAGAEVWRTDRDGAVRVEFDALSGWRVSATRRGGARSHAPNRE